MGVCENPLSLITEFLEGGSLLNWIQQTKENKEEITLNMRIDLVFGIARYICLFLFFFLEKEI